MVTWIEYLDSHTVAQKENNQFKHYGKLAHFFRNIFAY